MPCDRLALSHFMDGEPPEEEANKVRVHLVCCRACTDALRSWNGAELAVRRAMAMRQIDQHRALVTRTPPPASSSAWILVAISLFAFAAAWLFSLVWLGR